MCEFDPKATSLLSTGTEWEEYKHERYSHESRAESEDYQS